MKKITLACEICGRKQTFSAETELGLLDAIDDAGWDDRGAHDGLCPDCWEKGDDDWGSD